MINMMQYNEIVKEKTEPGVKEGLQSKPPDIVVMYCCEKSAPDIGSSVAIRLLCCKCIANSAS